MNVKKEVIYPAALVKIKKVHQLSALYNQRISVPHQKRLLSLMRKHVDEIEELFAQGDPHAIIETGDLIILCLELILERQASIDDVVNKCFERYTKKLSSLLKELDPKEGVPLDD